MKTEHGTGRKARSFSRWSQLVYLLAMQRRGEVKVKARVTQEVPEGLVWMAFHFREACANWLTNPVFDPVSQTAEYKACAVRLEKI